MTASLPAFARAYIQTPFSIFDKLTASSLAHVGWQQLTSSRGIDATQYSTATCLGVHHAVSAQPKPTALTITDTLEIEEPDFFHLQAFYDEHGLEPLSVIELLTDQAPAKLRRALTMLAKVAPAYTCVQALVCSVQLLRQPDPEIDVSYSHPAIPFSIFVTVCEEDSDLAALRVAEAILHETMHLHLTLLESVMELVQPSSLSVYYSPWREEDRPVRGVLHGLFVFRAVQTFYQELLAKSDCSDELTAFASARISAITQEVQLVSGFALSDGLTGVGKQLVTNLLECRTEPDSWKICVGNQ